VACGCRPLHTSRSPTTDTNLGANTDKASETAGKSGRQIERSGRDKTDGGPNAIGIVLLAFLAGRTDGIPEATEHVHLEMGLAGICYRHFSYFLEPSGVMIAVTSEGTSMKFSIVP
jgi:hypothetical protein